jgi:hypothetical protein
MNLSRAAISGAGAARHVPWSAIGTAALSAAGTGLSAAGPGIRGVANMIAPVGTLAGVGAGAALGVYQGWSADHEASRSAFTASANGYMARGAAMRSRNQGHY